MEHIMGCTGPAGSVPDPTGYSGDCLLGDRCTCWCHRPASCRQLAVVEDERPMKLLRWRPRRPRWLAPIPSSAFAKAA
jgi:hypothetical protein